MFKCRHRSCRYVTLRYIRALMTIYGLGTTYTCQIYARYIVGYVFIQRLLALFIRVTFFTFLTFFIHFKRFFTSMDQTPEVILTRRCSAVQSGISKAKPSSILQRPSFGRPNNHICIAPYAMLQKRCRRSQSEAGVEEKMSLGVN